MGTITTLRPCTTWCTRQHPKNEIAEEGETRCETNRTVPDHISINVAQSVGAQPLVSVWSGAPGGYVEELTEEETLKLAVALVETVEMLRRARGEG